MRAERLRLRPLGPERRQQEREAGHREQREHQTCEGTRASVLVALVGSGKLAEGVNYADAQGFSLSIYN